MNRVLQANRSPFDQHSASAIAREILGEIELNVTDGDNAASITMEKALDSYAILLEQQEKELIDELHRTVLNLSAKIAAVRHLRNIASYESGIQKGLREGTNSTERGETA